MAVTANGLLLPKVPGNATSTNWSKLISPARRHTEIMYLLIGYNGKDMILFLLFLPKIHNLNLSMRNSTPKHIKEHSETKQMNQKT